MVEKVPEFSAESDSAFIRGWLNYGSRVQKQSLPHYKAVFLHFEPMFGQKRAVLLIAPLRLKPSAL